MISTQLLRQVPGLLLIKNLDSIYFDGSQEMANFFGYDAPEQLQNETDHSINHPIAQYGDMFIKTDLRLKETNQNYTGCFIFPLHGVEKVFIFKKKFIKDNNGINIGIMSHSFSLDHASLEKKILSFHHDNYFYKGKIEKNAASYIVNDIYPGVNLSRRQAECLYYLLRGKSAAAIAEQLAISPRTAQAYIEELKHKMQCDNKSQLIQKSVESGYIDVIPPSIINLENDPA